MKIIKYRESLGIFITIYVGVTLTIIPYLIYGSFNGALLDVVSQLGYVFLTVGAVWFILERTIRRRLVSDSTSYDLRTQGIRDITVISPSNISNFLKDVAVPTVELVINYEAINRTILELVDNLLSHGTVRDIKIVLAGAESNNFDKIIANDKTPFETKIFLTSLSKLVRQGSTELRLSPTSSPYTILLGRDVVSLLLSYYPESDSWISIRIEQYSAAEFHYRRYFGELWEKSQEYLEKGDW